MKLNDTTKTVGSVIAVMLIPITVIGWNYYSGLSNNNNQEKLNVADISEDANANTNGNEPKTTEDPKKDSTTDTKSNTKPGDAIGGVKTLPNTSKHPTPDE